VIEVAQRFPFRARPQVVIPQDVRHHQKRLWDGGCSRLEGSEFLQGMG